MRILVVVAAVVAIPNIAVGVGYHNVSTMTDL
jgi:hypothetical protein